MDRETLGCRRRNPQPTKPDQAQRHTYEKTTWRKPTPQRRQTDGNPKRSYEPPENGNHTERITSNPKNTENHQPSGATGKTRKNNKSQNGFIQYAIHLKECEKSTFKDALAKAHRQWIELTHAEKLTFKDQAAKEARPRKPCPRPDCEQRSEQINELEKENRELRRRNTEFATRIAWIQQENVELKVKIIKLQGTPGNTKT